MAKRSPSRRLTAQPLRGDSVSMLDPKLMRGLALAVGLLAGCATSGRRAAPLGEVAFERIATWRDDARGAYSIIHDDTCGPGLEGMLDVGAPALARRGLRGAFGAIAGECETYGVWPAL